MKFSALALLVVSLSILSGCCSTGACVSSCDPCGRELANSGNPFKGMFQHKCHKCSPMGADCGYQTAYAGDCGTGNCGSYAQPASSCGCGQSHTSGMMPPTPQPMPQPAPHPMPHAAPAAVPAVPPVAPAPPDAVAPAATMRQMPVQTQRVAQVPAPVVTAPQQVSYEEFQKLPGVVIQQPAAPVQVPRVPPVLNAPQPGANWAPAR